MTRELTKIVVLAIALLMVVSAASLLFAGSHGTVHSNAVNSSGQSFAAVPGTDGFSQASQITGQYSLVPDQAAMNPNAQVSIVISFKPASGFQSFLNNLYNPSSPIYRQYVTAAQLGDMFGLNQQLYSKLAEYFEGYGLTVFPSASRLTMTVSGTVEQMERALNTNIGAFKYSYTSTGLWNPLFGNESAVKGSTTYTPVFYVSTSDISLPSFITQYVSGISGLNGMIAQPDLALPYGISPNMTAVHYQGNITPAGSDVKYIPSLNDIQNITYANYTWMPAAEAQQVLFVSDVGNYQIIYPSTMHMLTGAEYLWNGQDTLNGVPDMGQGITVAVVEVGFPYFPDIAQFSQQVFGNPNQVPDRVTYIGVGISSPLQGYIDGLIWGWTLETELDMEYIAAMAPLAHIDVVAVPNPEFTSFDQAYAFIAQYLTHDANISMIPPGNVVFGALQGATNVSIDSNSYGAPEWEAVFEGSPMYVTIEDTLLSELNAVGVTNFFAAGDEGSNSMAASPSMPSQSPAATSVGGGQTTAADNGVEYPVTNVIVNDTSFFPPVQMYVAQATSLATYTYWSYGGGLGGTFKGEVGGGFGQSVMEQQPWYEAGIDVYEDGALLDPIISGAASFNMTIYGFGTWNLFYGGTSFATPISAAEWALIEEQAMLLPSTNPYMGNINYLLFAVHNAYEANVMGVVNPFVPMQDIGHNFSYGPVNSYSWYLFNLSISQPADPTLPGWYATIFNPVDSGWTFLGGLGMLNAALMSQDLLGRTSQAGYSMLNPSFGLMQVTPSGLEPFHMLTAGQTYTFQIVLANGGVAGSNYRVIAYSGGQTEMITPSQNGTFTYTPSFTQPQINANLTEMGYFYITVAHSPAQVPAWYFQQFGVALPNATGQLELTVTNPEGIAENSSVEVPMFTTGETGFYNTYGLGPGEVMLNGQPVTSAVVSEISVNLSEFVIEDPTVPLASYAPGVTVGHFLTDGRGNFNFWIDALLAENNGPLYTQVVQLVATYRGLTSNVVTVYIEPQAGDFIPSVHLASNNTALVGDITFAGMKYVNYVNVSIGNMSGQYVNVTYPPLFYNSQVGENYSGVSNGVIPIDFTKLPPAGQPINLTMVASGFNDLTLSFSFFGFTFQIVDNQKPIVWEYQITIPNPGMDPEASMVPSHVGLVTGDVNISYSGSWASGSGAVGVLTLSSASGSQVLMRTNELTGTFDWNTSALMDGFYTLTFTVETPTGLSTSSSYLFYVDNEQAKLTSDLNNVEAQYASAIQTIDMLKAALQSSQQANQKLSALLSQANSTVEQLRASVASLESEYNQSVASLKQAQVQLSAYQQEDSQYASEVSLMQSQIAYYQNLTAKQEQQIMSLEGQVAQLQSELSQYQQAQHPGYLTSVDGWVGVAAISASLVALGLGIYFGVERRKR